MRQCLTLRHVLRFAVVAAIAAPVASGALSAGAGCGPFDDQMIWLCLNPVTGKLDDAPYDANHYVNGTFDPCHCYDPCGPQKSCPIEVDAGPPAPGCDTGDAGP